MSFRPISLPYISPPFVRSHGFECLLQMGPACPIHPKIQPSSRAVATMAWSVSPTSANHTGTSSTGQEARFTLQPPHPCLNKIRLSDVINSATYSAFTTGPIMIDHDNTVKSYSVSPSMLGRGHILMEPDGPVWVGPVFTITRHF